MNALLLKIGALFVSLGLLIGGQNLTSTQTIIIPTPAHFAPKALNLGGITPASPNFPVSLNWFQDNDVINAGDWNQLENAIGTTTATISSSTSAALSLFHLTQPTIRGGTGSAITEQKGDLLVGSSTPSAFGRLATSTDGYRLTSSSTAPFGVSWESPGVNISYSTYSTSTTWTKPLTGTFILVKVWGGGGAGGKGDAGHTGGGGGGGAYAETTFLMSAIPATTSIVIGWGGNAKTVAGNGNPGLNTVFGTSTYALTAYGGGGGGGIAGTAGFGGGGGGEINAGGSAVGATTNGLKGDFWGGWGGGGVISLSNEQASSTWAGGGGGAGAGSVGGSAYYGGGGGGGNGSAGGTSVLGGAGGAGGAAGAVGVGGTTPSGGGGGTDNGANSGPGGNGQVIIITY